MKGMSTIRLQIDHVAYYLYFGRPPEAPIFIFS